MMIREVRRLSPEELELDKKREELDALESELAQRELDFATLQAELRIFERRYVSTVGIRYAELHDVKAQVADLQAQATPADVEAVERAAEARATAQQTTEAVGGVREHLPEIEAEEEPIQEFKPSDRAKKLYREIAKNLHPDLTTDLIERQRRQEIMSLANEAYQRGDITQLESILREWEHSPDAVQGDGPAMELIRAIRKIAQIHERRQILDEELERMRASELFELKKMVDTAEKHGKNILANIAAQLDDNIAEHRRQLERLLQGRQHEPMSV